MGIHEENIYGGNARNNFNDWHFTGGSVADAQTTLISGVDNMDWDKHSVFVSLVDTGQASSVNVQVWQSNSSGNSAISGAIAQTNEWALVGSPIIVTSGTSAIKSWETTNSKWIAVTGSADAATSGGVIVSLFGKTKA